MFRMAVETVISGITISKTYSNDDPIWKKSEPEKRIRQMLADVRRELERKNVLWVATPKSDGVDGVDGGDIVDISLVKKTKDGETPWDFNSIQGCQAINEEVLAALTSHSDSIIPDQMVVRG